MSLFSKKIFISYLHRFLSNQIFSRMTFLPLKVIVHPKMKIIESFTQSRDFVNLYHYLSAAKHKRYFEKCLNGAQCCLVINIMGTHSVCLFVCLLACLLAARVVTLETFCCFGRSPKCTENWALHLFLHFTKMKKINALKAQKTYEFPRETTSAQIKLPI